MKPKKNSRSNLEHKRFTHLIIGLIVSLSLILISFEWTSTLNTWKAAGQAGEGHLLSL